MRTLQLVMVVVMVVVGSKSETQYDFGTPQRVSASCTKEKRVSSLLLLPLHKRTQKGRQGAKRQQATHQCTGAP